MKHTKGKWKWINQTTQGGDYYKVTGETVSVCNITTRDSKQAEANAKLIAAAPLLLEALMQIQQFSDVGDDFKAVCMMKSIATNAINKATL